MKATLYRLPAKNILVIEDKDGGQRVEYPATETRAHHIAQDAGVERLTFGRMEDLLKPTKKDKPIHLAR